MPLPKIDQPLFEIEIPSTGQKTQFRPFTVKEEKILLIAKESKDLNQIFLAVKQIIGNCVLNVDVDSLATFDYEYLLMHLRAKAVQDVIKFKIKDPEEEKEINLEFNINDVQVLKNPEHSKIIDAGNIKIAMRYPSLKELETLAGNEEHNSEKLLNIMLSCIDSLVQDDEVYKLSDFTQKEVDEFLESLTADIMSKIQKFFETLPVMKIECPYVNSKGENKTFVIQGIQTFFM
jgi:hypothetical protein